ncbi:hypothetical protein INT47_002544 [Mucor saturninus]|uniref:Uncharacterized protein n=1 Tax=Mucor saturninus TaxID=64648 RepID=A0A8H7RGK1_9FUNG|nr:hypothetical protein INT47_002544 [Mucor saturninus]
MANSVCLKFHQKYWGIGLTKMKGSETGVCLGSFKDLRKSCIDTVPEVGTRLSCKSIVVPGTYIRFRPRDSNRYVALGRVDEQTNEDREHFHITTEYSAASRVIATILHVSAPGYITREIAKTPRKGPNYGKPLASYLPVPFKRPLLKADLETESEDYVISIINGTGPEDTTTTQDSDILENKDDSLDLQDNGDIPI